MERNGEGMVDCGLVLGTLCLSLLKKLNQVCDFYARDSSYLISPVVWGFFSRYSGFSQKQHTYVKKITQTECFKRSCSLCEALCVLSLVPSWEVDKTNKKQLQQFCFHKHYFKFMFYLICTTNHYSQ